MQVLALLRSLPQPITAPLPEAVHEILHSGVYFMIERINVDPDKEAVARLFGAVMKWIQLAGACVLQVHYESFMRSIMLAVQEKAPCQKYVDMVAFVVRCAVRHCHLVYALEDVSMKCLLVFCTFWCAGLLQRVRSGTTTTRTMTSS